MDKIKHRDFLRAAGLCGLASPLTSPAQHKRNVKIGHTGITGWRRLRRVLWRQLELRRPSVEPVFKNDIVTTLNEYGKALADIGLTGCLHQHIGTCIESREETYAVMESVDTRVVKFGPDIGRCEIPGMTTAGSKPTCFPHATSRP